MSECFLDHRNNRPSASPDTERISPKSAGFVLLVTLVVLFVLATLGYNLASRVAASRHRNNYVIDYAVACYARDSALKYALSTLQDLNDMELISRPNEPDFSDLFAMKEQDYRKLIEQWAEELAKNQPQSDAGISSETNVPAGFEEDRNSSDFNESNLTTLADAEPNAFDLVRIRGPYGPPWPFVTEPVEFEIGAATVKFEIEDENAKYPAGWALLDDVKIRREAQAGLETFCEWMGYDYNQIDSIEEQLKKVGEIKPFRTDFKAVVRREEVTPRAPVSRGRRSVVGRAVYKTTTVTPADQIIGQARDFSRLFHSSLVDMEMLARPTIISEDRKESALKYMDLWGTTQVNINTAPRHVLEAAFTFGGDADKIADEIIKIRRKNPFRDIDDLKKQLFRYSDAIEKCRPYITATSSIFAIHVTAVSGTAKASAVIVVLKEGDKIQRIAVICG